MFSALKICQSSKIGFLVDHLFYWWPLRPGFPEWWMGQSSRRPLLPTQTVIVHSLCLDLVANGCNLEGTGLALLIHSSSELGGLGLTTYATDYHSLRMEGS